MQRFLSPNKSAPQHPGHPYWRLGFRPFYTGAALSALALVLLWIAVVERRAELPSHIAPVFWHMHEMLFGFAAAAIVGFLFTAGKTWTGLPTPRGGALMTFAALWLAARLAAVTAPYPVFFVIDAAFLPLAGAVFFDLIVKSKNYRNLGIAGILSALGALNIASHLANLGVIDLSYRTPLHAAVLLIIVLETVITGRIIPSFTMNALRDVKISSRPDRDKVTVVVTLLAAALWLMNGKGAFATLVMVLAGAAHFERSIRWKFWTTIHTPLLWILHFSYLWVSIGLLLLAASNLGAGTESAGIHALTVGSIGGLILGMITRTALGHTGRKLEVGRAEVAAYTMVVSAAIIRVFLPLAAPQAYRHAVLASGLLWAGAFGIYLMVYVPKLLAPRLDGRDG